MKYPKMEWGTMEAVVNKLGGMEGVQQFLRDELIVSKPPRAKVLNFHEEFSVGSLKKRFVPNEFFMGRQGLYLYNDMQRVLKNARIVESAEATKLRSFDLAKDAYDHEIKTELPERHEVALWQIAHLIEAQKNGEAGSLLTNGRANIFYVAGCAVDVNWNAGRRGWCVLDWKLDDGYWFAGDRVFSSN